MLYELGGVAVKAEGDYWVADSATVVGECAAETRCKRLVQRRSAWR